MARRKAATAGVPSEISSDALEAASTLAYRWLRRKQVDHHTAEDIASEVTIHLWEHAKVEPGLIDSRTARDRFTIGSAKHALLDHLRAEDRRDERHTVYERELNERRSLWMCPEDRATYGQLAEAFEQALSRTPYDRRTAFMLVHEEELSYGTAAEYMGVTLAAAESRVSTVRRELRVELAAFREAGDEPSPKKARGRAA